MAIITVNTRNGQKSVESSLSLADAYNIVMAKIGNSDFENDLCRAYQKWGYNLTSGRQAWLIILAQEHLDRTAGKQTTPTTQVANNLQAIRELFSRVTGKLKFPKFRLQTSDGRPVVIQIAGQGSKHTGQINVTTGEPYGTPGSFYGRIDEHGMSTVKDPQVLDLLREFAADPAGVAAAYGKLTGNCCFCKMALTDERSLLQGYGPVCADNYNLPWGNRRVQGDLPLEPAPVQVAAPAPAPAELTLAELLDNCRAGREREHGDQWSKQLNTVEMTNV